MKKLILASFIASIAMWVWGAVYWMNPLTNKAIKYVEDDLAVQAVLDQHFPESGTYFIPGMNTDTEVFNELHNKGPLAMVTIHKAGLPPMRTSVFIISWLHMWLISLILGFMLWHNRTVLPCYGCRLTAILIIGLLIGFLSEGNRMIWFYAPVPFSLVNIGYYFSVIAVAGLVLSAMVKSPPQNDR